MGEKTDRNNPVNEKINIVKDNIDKQLIVFESVCGNITFGDYKIYA